MKKKAPFTVHRSPFSILFPFSVNHGKRLIAYGKSRVNGKLKIENARSEHGVASIMVVFILVILLALVSISFTKIMDRTLQVATADQSAKAADYAAQSAINDTIAYIKANPTAEASECDDLLANPSFLQFVGTTKLNAPADPENLPSDTKYTCILVDPTPSSLQYQNLDQYISKVVQLKSASGTAAKFMFSWQSADRNYNQFPVAGQDMLDEKTWIDNKYAPLLRLTLYPMPAPVDGYFSFAASNAKTYFLYPRAAAGITTIGINSTGLQAVSCNTSDNKGTPAFIGTSNYDCNVVIDLAGAPAGTQYYFARLVPYYVQTSAGIKINNGSGAADFTSGQSIVDVTA